MFDFLNMVDDYNNRKIDRSEFDWGFISTCSVTDSIDPYETAVEHEEYNNGQIIVVETYTTIEEAKEGHLKWLKLMENPPEELEDVSTCFFAELARATGSLKYSRNNKI